MNTVVRAGSRVFSIVVTAIKSIRTGKCWSGYRTIITLERIVAATGWYTKNCFYPIRRVTGTVNTRKTRKTG